MKPEFPAPPPPRPDVFCRAGLLLLIAAAGSLISSPMKAEPAGAILSGPAAPPNVLARRGGDRSYRPGLDPRRAFDDWKAGIKARIGLDFGIEYNAIGYVATDSLGDDGAASGVFRIPGVWSLVNRDGPNTGRLSFTVGHRHAYSDVAPSAFGDELGYIGVLNTSFNDQGWRVTHLYWDQHFAEDRAVAYVGWLDTTDFVDVYALASAWTGFANLVFENGSGAIGGLPDGALGAMVGGFLSDRIYAVASITDANGDPTDIGGGFDTFFNDFETLKTFEIGWTAGPKQLFTDNIHLTVWQIDERDATGASDGAGIAGSLSHVIDGSWMPFLRGAWAHDGGTLYEASVSVGLGYSRNPGRDVLGIGLNWSRPNRDTFGADLDDQYTLELFQRWQVTEGLQMTPSLQIIKDPALNPDRDLIAVFGLRVRAEL